MPAGVAFDEAAFAKVVNRYKGARTRVTLVQRGLVSWAMREGIKEAQHQLGALVYSVPASRGNVYRKGNFFGTHASVRTGNTRRAVMVRGTVGIGVEGAIGEIFVNPAIANRKGFYYPKILNRGRTDIRYAPRPFWTNTKAIMRARYAAQGRVALRELGQRLRID